MEKDELKYNKLIGELRSKEPRLNNPEELTENIMWSIKKKESKVTKVIILARPWISAAAIFLIALFIYQNNNVPVQETRKMTTVNLKEKPERTDCLESLREGKINRKTLLQSYQCYQKRSEKNSNSAEQFMMKYQHKL